MCTTKLTRALHYAEYMQLNRDVNIYVIDLSSNICLIFGRTIQVLALERNHSNHPQKQMWNEQTTRMLFRFKCNYYKNPAPFQPDFSKI